MIEDGQAESPTSPPPLGVGVIGVGVIGVAMDRLTVVRRMRALSQRGKLPGFEETPEGFLALAYGWVFDYELCYRVEDAQSGSSLVPTLRLKRKMPALVIALLVVSVWPGVWITDSMLATYFSWYPREFWKTCVWYLPLTVLPIPWVWRTVMRRSRILAEESARELAERVGSELKA